MSKETKTVIVNPFGGFGYLIMAVATAMVGMQIHHNAFYAVVNFFMWPLAWIYWLITHHVTLSIIKSAFSFFFQ